LAGQPKTQSDARSIAAALAGRMRVLKKLMTVPPSGYRRRSLLHTTCRRSHASDA
jgi:hypothetical protein